MKDRIRTSIIKTPSLKEELNLLESSFITTFDSFSLSIVKKYHTKLNITDKVEITEEGIINLKKKELLDIIFDEKYELKEERFLNLIKDFTHKTDEELKRSILNIYTKIELKKDKLNYLNTYIDNYYTDNNINIYIEEYLSLIKEKQNKMITTLKELEEYFDIDFIKKLEDNFKELVYSSTYEEIIKGLDYKTIQVPKNSEEEGKLKKQLLFDIAKSIKELCIYESTNEMKKEIFSTKENASIIIDIIKELDKRLTTYKKENDIYNFTDIASLAIQVVEENEEIKEEVKNSFKEILIDEYQDTSDTQEKFISLIENNNVYMVGDVKQSIYRFRNANPYIFKTKYDKYSNNIEGIKIDLLKNFRSREEVLNNINYIFNKIMSDEIGGADYLKSHQMIFGNTTYQKEGKIESDANIEIITYDKNLGNITSTEEEIFIIANDIKTRIKEKYQVYDKNLKRLRNIEYKDFVILLDKSKYFDLYKKIFEYFEIPLSILKEESLKKEDDVLILKNLFKLLICIKENKNNQELIYTYTSVSRSFLYKTLDEEIFNVIKNNKIKETSLYKELKELVKYIDVLPLSSLFLKIIEKLNYEEKLITIGNMKANRVREEYFYNLCKNYEKTGNSIYEFTNYLDQVFNSDNDLKFNINTSSSNSVKIMTIHKSKGLEYPICYFTSFASRFNLSDLKERIIFDNKYGIVLPYVDEFYKDTIIKTLLKKHTKKEEISEKIRLFYVALTRAREKMIMVIPECDEEKEELDESIKEEYNSFLSIIKSIYSYLFKYIKKTNIIASKDYLYNKKNTILENTNIDKLKVEELIINKELIEEEHYSKETLKIPESSELSLMEFGSKIHEILEYIDFNNYNLSKYNINNNIKEKIELFINSNFMKDKLKYKMYKEYEFIYEEGNITSHGIIDLLIEKDNEMIIIDYKLKKINDIEYDKQLLGYKKVIEDLTNKKTSCYLYSILEGSVRKVA